MFAAGLIFAGAQVPGINNPAGINAPAAGINNPAGINAPAAGINNPEGANAQGQDENMENARMLRRRKLAQAKKEILERLTWYVVLSILGTLLLININSVSFVDVFIVNQMTCFYHFFRIRKSKPCRIYTFIQLFLFTFAYMAKPFAYIPCFLVYHLLYSSFQLHHVDDVPLPFTTFIIPTVFYACNYFGINTSHITKLSVIYGFSHFFVSHLSREPTDVFAMIPLYLSFYIVVTSTVYADVFIYVSYAFTIVFMDLFG